MLKNIFDVLLGEALSNEQGSHEKYNIPFGLAIMASDAIPSVAYAAQEILFVLIVLGATAYQWLTWTSFMIIGLLLILTISYIQIIRAYPQGGGAYKVARENIGTKAGLSAAAGLIISYILTVAVSASAGADAIISAFSGLAEYKVPFVLIIIVVLTILNLRGISESSKINISPDMESMAKLKKRGSELDTDIQLVSHYSPYRAVVTPLLKNIVKILDETKENEKVTVFVTHERWGEVLHNHTSFFIRETLLRNKNVVVSTYPYHLLDEDVCETDK